MLTESELGTIGRRAATLRERLRHVAAADPAATLDAAELEAATKRLELWRRAFSPDDPAAFERRLRWDGITLDHALFALAPSLDLPAEALSWTRWLPRFFAHAEALAGQLERHDPVAELAWFDEHDEPPFLEILVPLLRAGSEALADEAGATLDRLGDEARRSLVRRLARDLATSSELTLYERFKPARQRSWLSEDGGNGSNGSPDDEADEDTAAYDAFVLAMLRGGLSALLQRYAGLARQLAWLVETWKVAAVELARRLDADHAALVESLGGGVDPGPVVELAAGESDRHDGGRRVMILRFESGLRVVYKPRDLGIEAAYNELLADLGARGLEACPPALRTLERDGYGWVEFAPQGEFTEVAQVRDYYRAAGALMCISWTLRGSDLHMDNVVAADAGPVLVDTEMLVQPVVGVAPAEVPTTTSGGQRHSANKFIEHSCLGTGLLSMLQSYGGGLHDVGGLRGTTRIDVAVPVRSWHELRTDSLHFRPESELEPAIANEVVLDGSPCMPEEHTDAILDGFAAAYRFLLAHRDELLAPEGPIAALAGHAVRVLFRTSQQYGALLYSIAAPAYQGTGLARSLAVETLARPFAAEAEPPLLWPLVADELEALEAIDIPKFTVRTDSTALLSGRGEAIDEYVTVAGSDAVAARIGALTEDDLRAQLQVIRWALDNVAQPRFLATTAVEAPPDSPAADTLEDAQFLELAIWVGEEFLERGRADGDRLAWPLPEFLMPGSPDGIPISLYAGLSGTALFLAALNAVTGESRWHEAARAALRHIEVTLAQGAHDDQADVFGGCDGLTSLLYALPWAARLTRDEAFTATAKALLDRVDESALRSSAEYDVVGGTAGALLALHSLHAVAPESAAGDLAGACAAHLLDNAVPTEAGAVAWESSDGARLAGFAHGAAGIAYALVRQHELTGEERLLDAAAAGFRHERSLFSPTRGNWRVVSTGSFTPQARVGWMTAWCHGAPGVGLARVLAMPSLDHAELREEIVVALQTTANERMSRSDHLCCGNLGRAEVLLTSGLALRRPEIVAAARGIATQVARRALDNGRFGLPSSRFERRVFMPGFLQGLAGIGWQLLRLARPDRLPSVLAFEAPPTAAAGATVAELLIPAE